MRLQVGDVRLFFDTEGSILVPDGASMARRQTLILLHGGPGADHSLFKPEFSAMTDTAFLVYLDQRGSGRSDRSEPGLWTWQRWADDVAAFCAALDITDPILVGVSSGGMVAMHCAIRHSQLVAGLVLDSTLGVPTTLDETIGVFSRRGGPEVAEAARRYLGGDTSLEATQDWQRLCLKLYGDPESQNDLSERLARCLVNDEVQQHFRRGGCGPAELTSAEFAAIKCPTLVLAGEHDPVSPAAAAERLGSYIRHARIRVVPQVGHGVCRQAPRQAFVHLRAFLDVCSMMRGEVPDLLDTVNPSRVSA
ncbi:MAG TPA: alpha/beta hydrolase [Candidatus Limnocylindrales bacterium]|nr:alpha/beta hydrolase [Candidatus Limnocylindrales bacterium]